MVDSKENNKFDLGVKGMKCDHGQKKKWHPLRFRCLNNPCIWLSTYIDVSTGLVMQNSMTYFVSFWQPYLCHSQGQKHGFSIQILINLSKTFLRISPARNIAQTWIFTRLFEFSSSLLSLCFLTLFVVGFWWWCDNDNR